MTTSSTTSIQSQESDTVALRDFLQTIQQNLTASSVRRIWTSASLQEELMKFPITQDMYPPRPQTKNIPDYVAWDKRVQHLIALECLQKHPNDYLGCFRLMEARTGVAAYRGFSPFSCDLLRDLLVRIFSWAIPTDEVLECIAQYGPILEIGAGTGYWAHLLREKHGVDILAYDKNPPHKKANGFHGPIAWTNVLRGRASKAKKHPGRALMLCWPPYTNSMASDALKHYQGNTVIYIGEGPLGCTGDEEFHNLLRDQFKRVKGTPTLETRWPRKGDDLSIWVR